MRGGRRCKGRSMEGREENVRGGGGCEGREEHVRGGRSM